MPMFRRWLIWIMLFALPLQGAASAGMIHCAPGQHGHSNVAITKSHLSKHQHNVDDAYSAKGAAHHHHAVKANTDSASQEIGIFSSSDSHHSDKAACCAGGVLALTTIPSVMFPPQDVSISPSYSRSFWASVFLDALRRPPRSLLA